MTHVTEIDLLRHLAEVVVRYGKGRDFDDRKHMFHIANQWHAKYGKGGVKQRGGRTSGIRKESTD